MQTRRRRTRWARRELAASRLRPRRVAPPDRPPLLCRTLECILHHLELVSSRTTTMTRARRSGQSVGPPILLSQIGESTTLTSIDRASSRNARSIDSHRLPPVSLYRTQDGINRRCARHGPGHEGPARPLARSAGDSEAERVRCDARHGLLIAQVSEQDRRLAGDERARSLLAHEGRGVRRDPGWSRRGQAGEPARIGRG